MRYFILTILISLCPWGRGVVAQDSQTSEQAVKAIITNLFDGMRAGDSAKVAACFHADLRMATTVNREGEPMVFMGSRDRFVKAVGTPHETVWDERISDLQIQVDDNLASAWMKYSFYLGDTFSHCGVNTMTLVREKDGWKILYLADSRRNEKCE
ncbi:MAG: nuclear transport factor 2 family protein [Bacteroidota bacterium]